MTYGRFQTIAHIGRFSLTTANAGRLADFYEQAFNCRKAGTDRLEGADFERLMEVQGGAARKTLHLGRELVELLQFDKPGAAYPADTSASNSVFQHFAIVVSDMAEAYRHLLTIPGWTPITRGGPQTLPQSSGGVTAFKFRDPEGHPLELLAFAMHNTPARWTVRPDSGLFLGIDHTAISVRDAAASTAFYERLGFRASAQTHNHGIEQVRLDDIAGARVEVTAMEAQNATPHLELLCYRTSPPAQRAHRSNDIASTRIVLENTAQRMPPILLQDRDGHHLLITSSAA